MSSRLLVIQHENDAPAAWLGQWWNDLGLELTVVRGHLGEAVPGPGQWSGYDGLVVLGGAMSACDDAVAPWLAPTRDLIADAVAREVPTLGVCLGHQLASVALGDPLLRGPNRRLAVHYNDDVVLEVPTGATVLATLPDGRPQALRFGPSAWGVQFHPETSPEVFAAWLRWDSPDGTTPEQEALLAQVTAGREDLQSTWRVFAQRFAALLPAHPGVPASPVTS